MNHLDSIQPATEIIPVQIPFTPIQDLPIIFNRGRDAQKKWEQVPLKTRCKQLLQLREVLITESKSIARLIESENGKPSFEAISNELLPCIDFLTYFAKKTPRILRNQKVDIINPFLKLRKSYIEYSPLGIILLISPWNYPFLIPFSDLIMALVTGNAVIHKPSEFTPRVGLEIQKICEKSGLIPNLLQTVIGDGTLGDPLIAQKPDRIFFTGNSATGRKILKRAAEDLIPVNLELGGKDVMIILPDADLDFATSAALWGGFSNSGQACASVERLLIHRQIKKTFLELFQKKISALRPKNSDQEEGDLGFMTSSRQKSIYEGQVQDALKHQAILSGGQFDQSGRRLQPTLIESNPSHDLKACREESFGPIVVVESFESVEEAIQKANQNSYGLAASIVTRDLSQAREMASKLQVGTVTINEVLYTASIPGTPWGGKMESGFGRTHSDLALFDYTHIRHIHLPRFSWLTFKSFWWFPYTQKQRDAFQTLFEWNRSSWIKKIKAMGPLIRKFSIFLWGDRRI